MPGSCFISHYGFAALWVMTDDQFDRMIERLVHALNCITIQLIDHTDAVKYALSEIDKSIGYIDLECST